MLYRLINGSKMHDYIHNCVFIDEAGFNINMRRTRAWSQLEAQSIFELSSARAVSHSSWYNSAFGVINVSMGEPGHFKKKKDVGATKKSIWRRRIYYTKRHHSWPLLPVHQCHIKNYGCISQYKGLPHCHGQCPYP